MRTTITLRNTFHNSIVRLVVASDGSLSEAQVVKARRALCGIHDCFCGGIRTAQVCEGGSVRTARQGAYYTPPTVDGSPLDD